MELPKRPFVMPPLVRDLKTHTRHVPYPCYVLCYPMHNEAACLFYFIREQQQPIQRRRRENHSRLQSGGTRFFYYVFQAASGAALFPGLTKKEVQPCDLEIFQSSRPFTTKLRAFKPRLSSSLQQGTMRSRVNRHRICVTYYWTLSYC